MTGDEWLNAPYIPDHNHCRQCVNNQHTPVQHTTARLEWLQGYINWRQGIFEIFG